MSREILVCKGLGKKFGTRYALKDVDLTIESGKIIGLLGPNGSGKTTLMKLANGLLKPEEGWTVRPCFLLCRRRRLRFIC